MVDQTFRPWLVVLNICMMVILARVISYWLYRVRTPRIIGDIIAGCMLGPSLLGPTAATTVFTTVHRPVIKFLGSIGLMTATMTAGSNFDRRILKGQYTKVVVYTLLNVLVPTVLTLPLPRILPQSYKGPKCNSKAYFVYLASAICASALPFVFLILDELKIYNNISKFVIGFSCLSTISLFTLVSIASSLSHPEQGLGVIGFRVGVLVAIVVFLYLLQFFWGKLIEKRGPKSRFTRTTTDMCLFIILFCLAIGVASERLAYTFILGAFLAGAALPFHEGIRGDYAKYVKWMSRWILLPLFFLDIGLNFNLRSVRGPDVPYIIMFVLWGFAAKATLVPLTHFIFKMPWRDCIFCAALANVRGFNAMVIGSYARADGQFGDQLYIMCVLISLFSNMVAGPLARRFQPAAESSGKASGEGASGNTTRLVISPPLEALSSTEEVEEFIDKDEPPEADPAAPPTAPAAPEGPAAAAAASLRNLQTKLNAGLQAALQNPLAASVDAFTNLFQQLEHLQQELKIVPSAEAEFSMPASFLNDKAEESVLYLVFPEDLLPLMRRALVRSRNSGQFTGRRVVNWLMTTQLYPTRAVACEVCQQLMDRGFLFSVHKLPHFVDTYDKFMLADI
eukprot:TRINITY_DN9712_c0_g2_i1.p1 TRINITY_DN9712_c0_g2~~TRINITY_DN9712_c0_g2_i1.p1  ORF type:complete len:631 (-),score=103.62 TRINITY_DN9712_c0_g2_i1:11-1876(-)